MRKPRKVRTVPFYMNIDEILLLKLKLVCADRGIFVTQALEEGVRYVLKKHKTAKRVARFQAKKKAGGQAR